LACILSIERLHGRREIQLTACRFDEAVRPESVREAAQKGKIGCVMNRLMKNRPTGFTLMELMIVIVIIAILVALAYPSYIDYVRKAKRAEAQQLLLNWAINQEIWRSNNVAYNGIALGSIGSIVPEHDNYTFSYPVAPDATSYTLQAVADGDQASDTARDGTSCATLTLKQNGDKQLAPCWN